MNNCKTCGARCEKEYCFKHSRKKPLKNSIWKIKAKQFNIIKDSVIPNGEGVYNNIKMREFFLEIWAKRKHESEVSSQKLFGEPNSTYFHHILEKNNCPQAMYDEDNIILLSSIEHANVHSDMYRYKEINKRRELLLIKYNLK